MLAVPSLFFRCVLTVGQCSCLALAEQCQDVQISAGSRTAFALHSHAQEATPKRGARASSPPLTRAAQKVLFCRVCDN